MLLSVNVGMPKDVSWQGKTVYTGIWKDPVSGPRMVRRLNIDGDGQGDTNGHGGEQRAVFVYQIQSYEHWRQHLGRDDLGYGNFGENLTVDGLADDEVCIGDRYRIGEAEFEVTQPRVTCYRVGMRLGEPEMPALLVSHHRPGFYMRVITEGRIQAGDQIVKTATGPGMLSVADTDALLYLPHRDRAKLRVALQIPALSPGWQGSFRDLLAGPADGGTASAAPAPSLRRAGLARLPEAARDQGRAGKRERVIALPHGRRRRRAPGGLRGSVPHAAGERRRAARPRSAATPCRLTQTGGTYRISVKQEPHGVASGYLNRELRAGAILDVAAPRGDFTLGEDTGPVLLISAGIGVTPVLSMLHELAARGSQQEVWWLYGARGPREHPFAAEARALLASLPNAREHVFYSAATPAERRRARAAAGHLTKEALAGLGIPPGASAYICGPASFMADMQDALTVIGLGRAAIHTELFGALPSINPGITGQVRKAPHQPPGPPGPPPLVTFARSGITAPFGDDRHSVLDLADACDVPTRWSCRTGVCHTCVTPLLSGDIAYAPDPLEPPAEGQVLICCARPGTDIVLDM